MALDVLMKDALLKVHVSVDEVDVLKLVVALLASQSLFLV